jgi:hypothetical protein
VRLELSVHRGEGEEGKGNWGKKKKDGRWEKER